MELYAEDAVQAMHDGTFEGRVRIRERLARDLRACPDAHYTVIRFVEQGEGFADEWTFVGNQTGPLRLPDGTDLPPTGKRLEVRGMEYVQVQDGKITIDNLYYDSLAILSQLGVVPNTAAA